jgi:hypothetical protein
MKPPLDSHDLIPSNPQGLGPGPSLALEVEKEDLETRLKIVKRKEKRHLLWTILGFSPGAAIPALGLMREGSTGLLLLLGGLVVVYQGYSWNKAAREAERLEKELHQLSEGE